MGQFALLFDNRIACLASLSIPKRPTIVLDYFRSMLLCGAKMSGSAVATIVAGLTDKQRLLIEALADGASVKAASKLAGYAHEVSAHRNLSAPHVQLALQKLLAVRVRKLAPLALDVVTGILSGAIPAPATVKLDAAKTVLDRAGIPALRGAMAAENASGDKPLGEMTLAELRSHVEELKRAEAGEAPLPDASLDDMLA